MFIQTEATPNPHALKFFPGVALSDSSPTRWSVQSEDLSAAPLAKELLALGPVTEVLITRDYVSVRKDVECDWASLKILVLLVIADFVEFGRPAVMLETEQGARSQNEQLSQVEQHILEVLDAYVRPAVARDGGDVRLHDYLASSKTVRLELLGACGGCPSARVTLKQGIERILRERLAFVHHVEEFKSSEDDASKARKQRLRKLAEGGGVSRPQTQFSFNTKPVASKGT
ncbi:iron transporter [Marinicauda pacifica]|uniref:NifU family protein n=1 Tax=Marinicauda pacifica TaxID=1133559 RepID=A0A4V3RYZ2_9PROT|nr:NifU family protein [Marinicauda pacifica]TGY92259.1 NifU family protein [Marinicauda pacifica]GGE47381.1 iron transporter [Marinicauda pacifica]